MTNRTLPDGKDILLKQSPVFFKGTWFANPFYAIDANPPPRKTDK